MSIKISISGKTATGKTTVAKTISEYLGYPIISFSGVLIKYSKENQLPYDKVSLRQLGQQMINDLGQTKFMDWIIEFSSDIQWDKPVIVEGFRHINVYKRFVEVFPRTVLVYCLCSQKEQIERITKRDRISRSEALDIICHTMEQGIEELKSCANYLFDSKSNLGDLTNYLKKIIET